MSDHPPTQVGSKLLLGTLIERWRKRAVVAEECVDSADRADGPVLIRACADELEAALATLPQQPEVLKFLEMVATDAGNLEWRRRVANELLVKLERGALPPVPPQEQEPALCGAQCGHLSCDREAGHDGNHRGYDAQIDEPMFWPSSVNEHAGGSLNGPSRLGASPNTDTGGECVLVPRSIVVSMVNLCDVTKLGLHGTPWAQAELKALQTKLESRLASSPPAQEQEQK